MLKGRKRRIVPTLRVTIKIWTKVKNKREYTQWCPLFDPKKFEKTKAAKDQAERAEIRKTTNV